MLQKFYHLAGRRKKTAAGVGAAMLLLLVAVTTVQFDIKGHFDGIFVLKGKHGWKYEVKDDLYVGDGDRVVYSLDFDDPGYRLSLRLHRHDPAEPHLFYEWDHRDGSGYIRNFLGNGTQLLTCFGRYHDDDGEAVHGLFVGGGMPASITGGDNVYMNETGMAYFNGTRWFHVWCNVNEGIMSAATRGAISPARWKFLGSRVLDQSNKTLVLTSSHEAEVDGVPLKIDRYVYLNAGEPYFTLTIKITNIGSRPVEYVYLYGDEPWVGNYGSSAGNVGWVRDRLVQYEEEIDSRKYTWAGLYDYGNSAIGEEHAFTGTADFIEWLGEEKPYVYFSNLSGGTRDTTGRKVPLSSDTRFIGLEYGPSILLPNRSVSYHLAIGMAGHDPKTGFPVKPLVRNVVP